MPSRIAAALIIGFWLVMSTLLFRLEVQPEKSAVLNVPVAHVLKLMFVQAQASSLNILEGDQPIGNLSIRPRVFPGKNERSLEFAGNVALRLPLMERQRVMCDGVVQLDRDFNVRGLTFGVLIRDTGYKTIVTVDPRAHRVSYEIKDHDVSIDHASFPLDDIGTGAALHRLGVDMGAIATLQANLAAPTITAKQSELKIRSAKIDAYQLTVRQGDSVLADIYVSQLGQILMARTLFGYTFSSDDISF